MSFVGIFPASYAAMRLAEAVLGISSVARLDSVVVMTAIATLLDGAALMWFPQVYENPELMKRNSPLAMLLSRRGGAWILWGVGAGLVLRASHLINIDVNEHLILNFDPTLLSAPRLLLPSINSVV